MHNYKYKMRILKSHPFLRLMNAYVIDHSQPTNISYLWNFGSLLGLCLVIQIVTGVTLAMELCLCSYKILQIAGISKNKIWTISRVAAFKKVESSETKGKTCD